MIKKLVAIDGYSLLHRAYFAMPPLCAPDATPTGALTGFLNMLMSILEKAQPDYLLVAFDMKGGTFRGELYPEYKANRPPMPEDLRVQVELLKETLDAMGIARVESFGYEADDILGAYSALCEKQQIEAILVTGDRDSFQLIGDYTTVWMTRKGISLIDVFDTAKLAEVYGIKPAQIVDLKGLMGDTSDNIPGVPKVGEKTALKLLAKFGTLEQTLAHADEAGGPKLCENLKKYAQQARLSYQLAAIVREVPNIPKTVDGFSFSWPALSQVQPLMERLGLQSILKKLSAHAQDEGETVQEEVGQASAEVISIVSLETLEKKAAEFVSNQTACAIYMDQDHITFSDDVSRVYSVAIAKDLFSENALAQDVILRALAPVFSGENEKTLYDIKNWKQRLAALDIRVHHAAFDVMIAAYVLDATVSAYPMDRLLMQYLNTGDAPNASMLLRLRDVMTKKMRQEETFALFRDVEMPLIDVLYAMQRYGFKVDEENLKQIGVELGEKIDALAGSIYEAVGHPFNINSPKQLGAVLFEELGLPAPKKTKSGYSTDADTLEQLLPLCPMIGDILAYRQASKLKGTYVDGMLPLIDSQSRIHSTFNQTVTATGRISSSEPNLQNIPVRTELGRTLRRIFSADDENRVLVDADYSQIELRVLAHLSGDEAMCEAFEKGLDIHRDTAAKMWKVPLDEVTNSMRAAAKAINFGIVYGISDFGLAKNIGISRKEAAEFIRLYKETYSGVTRYMDEMVESAKALGYAKTMFGRRRALPELTYGNYNTRNFGVRVAMNMPIQGTAADIIKLAMIRVHQALDGKQAKLILQVHDELIVDCDAAVAQDVLELVRDTMQNVTSLRVPLLVDASIGRTWYDAK